MLITGFTASGQFVPSDIDALPTPPDVHSRSAPNRPKAAVFPGGIAYLEPIWFSDTGASPCTLHGRERPLMARINALFHYNHIDTNLIEQKRNIKHLVYQQSGS